MFDDTIKPLDMEKVLEKAEFTFEERQYVNTIAEEIGHAIEDGVTVDRFHELYAEALESVLVKYEMKVLREQEELSVSIAESARIAAQLRKN